MIRTKIMNWPLIPNHIRNLSQANFNCDFTTTKWPVKPVWWPHQIPYFPNQGLHITRPSKPPSNTSLKSLSPANKIYTHRRIVWEYTQHSHCAETKIHSQVNPFTFQTFSKPRNTPEQSNEFLMVINSNKYQYQQSKTPLLFHCLIIKKNIANKTSALIPKSKFQKLRELLTQKFALHVFQISANYKTSFKIRKPWFVPRCITRNLRIL